MLPLLELSLKAASPRYSVLPTPCRAVLIHGSVLVLWCLLFAMAFRYTGILAWSTGIVYVVYDTALLLFVFWQTLSLVRVPLNGSGENASKILALPSPGKKLSVTLGVIVAAHNEATVLSITLSALLGQHDAPEQIVIADDGSTDDTAGLLQRDYGLSLPIMGTMSECSTVYPSLRWLRLSHDGKARALNVAIVQMSTDIVLTVDGDTLLEPDAIGALRGAFSNEPALS